MFIRAKEDEKLKEKDELWKWLKETDEALYKKVRFSLLGIAMNLPGKVGRSIFVGGYKIAHKVFGFN